MNSDFSRSTPRRDSTATRAANDHQICAIVAVEVAGRHSDIPAGRDFHPPCGAEIELLWEVVPTGYEGEENQKYASMNHVTKCYPPRPTSPFNDLTCSLGARLAMP